jgi:molecular chaperone GrpE (heat shock protein)
MNEKSAPRISKLPFIIGDLLLVATAAYVAIFGTFLGQWQYVAIVAAVAFGAWLMVWPFVLEFRALTRLVESAALTDVTAKVADLDKVAESITNATAEWQRLQINASHAVAAAEHVAERMTSEARNFGEFFTKLNESEKAHLRLEVEKLRRAEGDWLGIIVRILDHVHALHQAGLRAGQRNVIDQLTHFQSACRDTVRRIGLMPIVPEPGTPFSASAHQLLDGAKPAEDALLAEVLAPGYTFQGQVIRLPVVSLKNGTAKREEIPDTQLSLDEVTSRSTVG